MAGACENGHAIDFRLRYITDITMSVQIGDLGQVYKGLSNLITGTLVLPKSVNIFEFVPYQPGPVRGSLAFGFKYTYADNRYRMACGHEVESFLRRKAFDCVTNYALEAYFMATGLV